MRHLLSPELLASATFALYRYRYLFRYVVIGGLSLVVEITLYRGLEQLGMPLLAAGVTAVLFGILFAYWGNVRFNFKVPVAKRRRALWYFAAISALSWTIQYVLRRRIDDTGLTYEQARIAISGALFGLAYLLHRRYSFADFKKVGVAVYANGIEDIRAIHRRIENFPDIIHVDLVDRTYGREDQDVRTYRLEAIRAYWSRKPIHAHVMSRTPSRYLDDLFAHVDRIYVHAEMDEDLGEIIARIRRAGREAGVALALETPLDALDGHLSGAAGVLFLAIDTPGRSGQAFQMSTLERIAEFARRPERSRLDVCVDGGVTEANVGLLNVEIVVSGSSVLTHADPRRQIMRLQTSSSYEQL